MGQRGPSARTILGARLDDLVEHFGLPVPTHAKIDVDGYELEVLDGAERTLACPEWRSILIELDPAATGRNRAVTSLLTNAGFAPLRRHETTGTARRRERDAHPVAYWTFVRGAD